MMRCKDCVHWGGPHETPDENGAMSCDTLIGGDQDSGEYSYPVHVGPEFFCANFENAGPEKFDARNAFFADRARRMLESKAEFEAAKSSFAEAIVGQDDASAARMEGQRVVQLGGYGVNVLLGQIEDSIQCRDRQPDYLPRVLAELRAVRIELEAAAASSYFVGAHDAAAYFMACLFGSEE